MHGLPKAGVLAVIWRGEGGAPRLIHCMWRGRTRSLSLSLPLSPSPSGASHAASYQDGGTSPPLPGRESCFALLSSPLSSGRTSRAASHQDGGVAPSSPWLGVAFRVLPRLSPNRTLFLVVTPTRKAHCRPRQCGACGAFGLYCVRGSKGRLVTLSSFCKEDRGWDLAGTWQTKKSHAKAPYCLRNTEQKVPYCAGNTDPPAPAGMRRIGALP